MLYELSKLLNQLNFKKESAKVYQLSSLKDKEELPFEEQYREEIADAESELKNEEKNYISSIDPIKTDDKDLLGTEVPGIHDSLNNSKLSLKDLFKILDRENFIPLTNSVGYSGFIDVETNEPFNDDIDLENSKILSERGILGMGAFGIVFSGIYSGKPAAAKIIIGKEYGEVEYQNWSYLNNIKNGLDANTQKFLPELFKLNQGSIVSIRKKQNINYSIIITEQLFKPKNIPNSLFSSINHNSNPIEFYDLLKKMEDSQLLDNICRRIEQDVYYQTGVDLEFDISRFIEESSDWKSLKEQLKDGYEKNTKNNVVLFDKIIKTLDKIAAILYNEILKEVGREKSNKKIRDNIYKILSSINSPLPRDHKSNIYNVNKFRFDPQFSGLINALEDLSSAGLEYSDLHKDNLMQNAQGQLKIIDFGLWELDKNMFYDESDEIY